MTLDELLAEHDAEVEERRKERGNGLFTAAEVSTLIARAYRLGHHEGATKPQPTVEELLAQDDEVQIGVTGETPPLRPKGGYKPWGPEYR